VARAILLTGKPGCGKTTLIRRVLEDFPGDVGGFYTQEIREAGMRKGFEIITLGGKRGVLAHVDICSSQRIGKYGVDLQALDRLVVPAIQGAVDRQALVVIDEIGPMEIRSTRFRKVINYALRSDIKVLGTIAHRSMPFTDEIKRMPDVSVIEVNQVNRQELPERILKRLRED
jgi:nucleoside-triphosphatase